MGRHRFLSFTPEVNLICQSKYERYTAWCRILQAKVLPYPLWLRQAARIAR